MEAQTGVSSLKLYGTARYGCPPTTSVSKSMILSSLDALESITHSSAIHKSHVSGEGSGQNGMDPYQCVPVGFRVVL